MKGAAGSKSSAAYRALEGVAAVDIRIDLADAGVGRKSKAAKDRCSLIELGTVTADRHVLPTGGLLRALLRLASAGEWRRNSSRQRREGKNDGRDGELHVEQDLEHKEPESREVLYEGEAWNLGYFGAEKFEARRSL